MLELVVLDKPEAFSQCVELTDKVRRIFLGVATQQAPRVTKLTPNGNQPRLEAKERLITLTEKASAGVLGAITSIVGSRTEIASFNNDRSVLSGIMSFGS